jgi:hypothetical protein
LRREMIIVNHHPQGGKGKTLASTHEYMLACVARGSDRTLRGRLSMEGIEHRPFKRSGTAESNFRRARPNSCYTRNDIGSEMSLYLSCPTKLIWDGGGRSPRRKPWAKP